MSQFPLEIYVCYQIKVMEPGVIKQIFRCFSDVVKDIFGHVHESQPRSFQEGLHIILDIYIQLIKAI